MLMAPTSRLSTAASSKRRPRSTRRYVLLSTTRQCKVSTEWISCDLVSCDLDSPLPTAIPSKMTQEAGTCVCGHCEVQRFLHTTAYWCRQG
ncbi:TPA: hypothetical protein N0F65_012343 [Lagenidium giganteum]|uniref:Uncharacterized protein n=1 Tax=Lagenidium giganteum TaxID=4803 RepID=A0AAV2YRB9_9STRA|nr:TPA: hypothetical protein N0F65_012343 [Lagenidium giganteum]